MLSTNHLQKKGIKDTIKNCINGLSKENIKENTQSIQQLLESLKDEIHYYQYALLYCIHTLFEFTSSCDENGEKQFCYLSGFLYCLLKVLKKDQEAIVGTIWNLSSFLVPREPDPQEEELDKEIIRKYMLVLGGCVFLFCERNDSEDQYIFSKPFIWTWIVNCLKLWKASSNDHYLHALLAFIQTTKKYMMEYAKLVEAVKAEITKDDTKDKFFFTRLEDLLKKFESTDVFSEELSTIATMIQ